MKEGEPIKSSGGGGRDRRRELKMAFKKGGVPSRAPGVPEAGRSEKEELEELRKMILEAPAIADAKEAFDTFTGAGIKMTPEEFQELLNRREEGEVTGILSEEAKTIEKEGVEKEITQPAPEEIESPAEAVVVEESHGQEPAEPEKTEEIPAELDAEKKDAEERPSEPEIEVAPIQKQPEAEVASYEPEVPEVSAARETLLAIANQELSPKINVLEEVLRAGTPKKIEEKLKEKIIEDALDISDPEIESLLSVANVKRAAAALLKKLQVYKETLLEIAASRRPKEMVENVFSGDEAKALLDKIESREIDRIIEIGVGEEEAESGLRKMLDQDEMAYRARIAEREELKEKVRRAIRRSRRKKKGLEDKEPELDRFIDDLKEHPEKLEQYELKLPADVLSSLKERLEELKVEEEKERLKRVRREEAAKINVMLDLIKNDIKALLEGNPETERRFEVPEDLTSKLFKIRKAFDELHNLVKPGTREEAIVLAETVEESSEPARMVSVEEALRRGLEQKAALVAIEAAADQLMKNMPSDMSELQLEGFHQIMSRFEMLRERVKRSVSAKRALDSAYSEKIIDKMTHQKISKNMESAFRSKLKYLKV